MTIAVTVNEALEKARDEICRTFHVSHLHEVLVGFDMAAEAAANAVLAAEAERLHQSINWK